MDIDQIRLNNLDRAVEMLNGQAEYAAKVGVSSGYISQMQTGRRPFNEKTAIKHAKALGFPDDWFSINRDGQSLDDVEPSNVTSIKDGLIPLISWVKAGEFCEAIDVFEPGYADDWCHKPLKGGDKVYALKVYGDSMTSPYPGARSYPPGMIIYVDPEQEVTTGSRGIFKAPNDNEVTFKELVSDGGKLYMKPLNPQYDKKEVTDDIVMCGKVIGIYMPE